MGKHPSLIHFAIMRLDSLMAIGSSRHHAKIALREASEEKSWTVSTGKIFSHTTRKTYQQLIIFQPRWMCRATDAVRHKHAIDPMPRSDHYHRREEGSSQPIMMPPLQKKVSKALGHRRKSIVLTHYLR